MIKQQLSQKLLQKLSPQQIQFIKLLEIPAFRMEERVKKELEENPMLEVEDKSLENNENTDISIDEYIRNDNDIPSYRTYSQGYLKELPNEIPIDAGNTFYEFLKEQLKLRNLSSHDHYIALYVIGNIDENGYMRRKLKDIVDDLLLQSNIDTNEAELRKIVSIIQSFDPSGVGAHDLQECLILQIDQKVNKYGNSIELKIAKEILTKFFEEFSKKHYDKIITQLEISNEDIKAGVNEILKLNPKPGLSYANNFEKAIEYIIPDFIIENKEGILNLSLNKKTEPELKISYKYHNLLEGYSKTQKKKNYQDKNTITFIKQKLDSAKWFINSIKQRQQTLLFTMQAIMDYQKDFFLTGEEFKLKPMMLKTIAIMTDLDISTISRVSNSKSVQTHFGIFPLKFFFSEGMKKESGEEISTREIKKVLKEYINNENKSKPLSDDKLTKILQKNSYPIARRTVAKYREQLGIAVARLRKELK